MKKFTALLLIIGVICGSIGVVSCAASLGSGIDAVASSIELVKTAVRGEKLCFSDGDFKSAFTVSDFSGITVTRLPSEEEGTLLSAGRRVKEGQVIKRRNLGSLVFVPSSREVGEASFTFRMNGTGAGLETRCVMKFIERGNAAPTVPKDMAVSSGIVTQADIPVISTLAGSDPEGDAIEFIIVSFPKNGAARITDRAEGRFEYTPERSFVGYDKFEYVVRDEYGNYSKPATVSIRVIERMSNVVFRDMMGRSEYSAAVALSAMGVMNGVKRGDGHYFDPEGSVTRAEFVAMALKAVGVTPAGVGVSFFDDNAEIPAALVGYVAHAARCGIVDGDFDERGLVFRPNEQITAGEAAVIMARLIGVDAGGEESVFHEDASVPSWAVPSVYAMYSLGIFKGDAADFRGDTPLYRGATAEYLYRLAGVS